MPKKRQCNIQEMETKSSRRKQYEKNIHDICEREMNAREL